MKSLIFVALIGCSLAAVSLDFTKQCGCADYKISTDCTGSCVWANNACKTAGCSDYTTEATCSSSQKCKWSGTACAEATACTDFATQALCTPAGQSDLNCVWGTACAAFTKCSDYAPTSGSCLSVKKQKCQVNSADSTKCADYTATTAAACSTFTTQATCDANYGRCAWATTCKDFTACSVADGNSTACAYKGSACTYTTTDNKCAAKTCAAITVEASCTYVASFDSKSGTLCAWANSKCADAADTKALKSDTCRTNTGYTYTWDGTNCNQCSSNAYILGLIVALLVLFI